VNESELEGHSLAGEGISQNTERKRAKGGYSLAKERKVRDKLGFQTKASERARGTHPLESEEGETSQVTPKERESEGLPTHLRAQVKSQVRTSNEMSERGALTS
jgi:hypothetical protein